MKPARAKLPLVVVVVLLVGLLVPTAAPAERTIALNTGTVELSLAPGGIANETLRVANNGTEPLKALLYSSDVRYDEQGNPDYIKPTGDAGEFLRSPASWLNLRIPDTAKVVANTPYIELDPGDELEIAFEMRVPSNATPGDYNAIIFFEMFEFAGGDTGTTSRIAGRIGARIVLRVAGDVIDDIDVAPYSVRSFVIGDTVPYSFRVTNDGNIDKRYVPSLVVLDGSEAERMRSVVESSAVVYAQNQREYVGALKLENASFGRFTMRAEVAYDRETGSEPGTVVPASIEKDRVFWVIPLWAAIAALIGIGLPILWVSWRLAVRSTQRKNAEIAELREERRRRIAEERHTSFEDELGEDFLGAGDSQDDE